MNRLNLFWRNLRFLLSRELTVRFDEQEHKLDARVDTFEQRADTRADAYERALDTRLDERSVSLDQRLDTRDAAAQQHKPAPAKEPRPKRAAPPTPPVRPAGRGLAVLAVASAVAGAVVAVVAGLVVVNRLDARTPGPGPQDPGSTSGATVASQGNAASTTTAVSYTHLARAMPKSMILT